MLSSLGNPERHFHTVHIGGTNGKGSVAAMVYQALREAGHRTGLYTSPHLVDARERIVVNDRPITEEAVAMWTTRLRDDIESSEASFFEALTAIAFADFAARGADVVVVEVGMGGRLDSTNVVTPLVSAVVSVGRDHADYLGDSLEDIAAEKAGIAKHGIPFVIGERDPQLARALEAHALRKGAYPVLVPSDVRYDEGVGFAGAHQRRNAAVADLILRKLPVEWRPSDDAIRRGIAGAYLPGRFDRRGYWLFDVAHNVDSMKSLVETMGQCEVAPPVHAVVGILADKDWATMLSLLRTVTDRLWLVASPTTPPGRRWNLEQAQSVVPGAVVSDDFERALHDARTGASTVLVTGSFYTVGDALSRLPGFQPLG